MNNDIISRTQTLTAQCHFENDVIDPKARAAAAIHNKLLIDTSICERTKETNSNQFAKVFLQLLKS